MVLLCFLIELRIFNLVPDDFKLSLLSSLAFSDSLSILRTGDMEGVTAWRKLFAIGFINVFVTDGAPPCSSVRYPVKPLLYAKSSGV